MSRMIKKRCGSDTKNDPSDIATLGSLLPAILMILRTKEEEKNGAQLTADDITIIREASRGFMSDNEVKDRIIKTAGFSNGVPYICDSVGLHSSATGLGVALYETRNNDYAFKHDFRKPNERSRIFRYATATFPHGDFLRQYFIARKGDVFAIHRYFKRLEKKSNLKTPPILEDGLLNRIVQNSIQFLINRKEIEKYGVRLRRGIVLDGPPGNGKTMACKWLKHLCANHNIVTSSLSPGDLEKAYREGRLAYHMNFAEVIFLDDIDISFFNRKSSGDSKMACAMLSAMDGVDNGRHCIRIFTTNESVKDMDPAFMRPGRVDCIYYFKKPTSDLRRRLIDIWPAEIRNNIDIKKLVSSTKDFSFAEIEEIRTLLVTNKIIADKGWDLDAALEAFYSRDEAEAAEPSSKMGFATHIESKEKLTTAAL